MRLEEMHLARNNYSFDFQGLKPGAIGGRIKFTGAAGNVEVVLKEHHVSAILAAVADSLVEHTRELANELTAEVIEHAANLLPAGVA